MDNLDDLELLAKDELIDLLRERPEAGVKMTFPGKALSRRIARRVRPRVQKPIAKYGAGDEEERARNLLLEGDNLQALVTLYKERGQVDLILTDPPYNTGGDWRYNDRWDEDPNDPGIGDLVSAEDRARHTKWMKFMYPRLQMMKQMLKPGGVLAICIDHRELFRLGQMLDELFDEKNRLAIINWEKSAATRSQNEHVSTTTEYILVYGKDEEKVKTHYATRTEADNKRYGNHDGDTEGLWREGNLTARTWTEKDDYAIQSPFSGELFYPAGEGAWRHPKRNIKTWLEEWGTSYKYQSLGDGKKPALVLDGEPEQAAQAANERLEAGQWPFIWFGLDGMGRPRAKTYLQRIKKGKVSGTYWADEDMSSPEILGATSWDFEESGRTSDGVTELTSVVGQGHGFNTVKPLKLFTKLIELWCPLGGVVLDPFAGSGTAGHAVLALNNSEGSNRRFILVEQGRPERGDSYARTLTADRLQRVVAGNWASGATTPLEGGFEFRTLTKQVDATALLQMEREEMVDTVIASYFDPSRRRGPNLVRFNDPKLSYLVAKGPDDEGFFLVWGGASKNIDLTEEVYEDCVTEAEATGLKPPYHIYARYNLFATEGVHFYQIPDRILADFGLDIRTESYVSEDET